MSNNPRRPEQSTGDLSDSNINCLIYINSEQEESQPQASSLQQIDEELSQEPEGAGGLDQGEPRDLREPLQQLRQVFQAPVASFDEGELDEPSSLTTISVGPKLDTADEEGEVIPSRVSNYSIHSIFFIYHLNFMCCSKIFRRPIYYLFCFFGIYMTTTAAQSSLIFCLYHFFDDFSVFDWEMFVFAWLSYPIKTLILAFVQLLLGQACFEKNTPVESILEKFFEVFIGFSILSSVCLILMSVSLIMEVACGFSDGCWIGGVLSIAFPMVGSVGLTVLTIIFVKVNERDLNGALENLD